MAGKISQKTIVEAMRALRDYGGGGGVDYTELLYERSFPDWFVVHAQSQYQWAWKYILLDMRSLRFFFSPYAVGNDNITGQYLNENQLRVLGEWLIGRLAAFAATLHTGQPVLRSLELDGFAVNREKLTLVPLEGPVSAQEEEDVLTDLVKSSGLPGATTILSHIGDAHSLYAEGKYHPSLNESRNLIQALIDGISVETDKHGKHPVGLPGGTANRMEYLTKVGFFTNDERSAFNSAWGSLSAGSHPGVSEREQARIGLVLALEFGQLLLVKFTNWKTNGYRRFS